MLVLFDNGTPRTLARYLIDQHTVTEARAHGRKLAIVVLGKGRWSLIKPRVATIVAAVKAAAPGSVTDVEIPYE